MSIAQKLKKSIQINASPNKVWDAIVNPEIIKKWLFDTNTISDWQVGSSILFTGIWEGVEYADKGIILKFDIEKAFEYSYWSSFSALPDLPENYSIVSFELQPIGNNTILNISQSNFANETSYEHSDKNWEVTLTSIKNIVEN